MKVGDNVETILGVGKIVEIRDYRAQGDNLCYLICLGRSGFPSDSDVFTEEEVFEIS